VNFGGARGPIPRNCDRLGLLPSPRSHTLPRMTAPPDYYRVLHVQPDAPAAIIHASYRTLAQRAQVSTRGGEDAALLAAAYAVLGDPQRRASYDLERLASREAARRDGVADTGAPGNRSCLFCGAPHGLERVLERDDECGRCASPLFAAERHRFEFSGQRMLRRIPKRHAIEVWVTWPQAAPLQAEMRDLSLNGMSFAAAVRLQPNQVVRVDCSELRALGRVAHIERDAESRQHFCVGIEFLTLRFRQIRGSFVEAEA
jgi:hypothetical protein